MSLIDDVKQIKGACDTFAREVIKPPACIFCGGARMWWNGYRTRAASVWIEGTVHHLTAIRCRRVKCGSKPCRQSWVLRPPGLATNKRNQLCVVASAACAYLFNPKATQTSVAKDYDCSERTVGRWLRWVSEVADPAVLQRKVLEALGDPILVPVLTVANLERKARHAARQEFLPRAANVRLSGRGRHSQIYLHAIRTLVLAHWRGPGKEKP